jgi:MOSC domain-containing protein
MTEVGAVAQLWRYPVKSFQGEQVDELAIAPGGAAGDRLLAVVDPAEEKVLSAKRYADLLLASARLDGSRVVITLPDASEHASDDPGVHAALSAWLGMDVRLEPPPSDRVYPMEMYKGMSDESTPLFDWGGPPGTWLDLADSHWVTTASLATIAGEHPDGQWDVRRFRPNGLIETTVAGYAEESWPTFELGEVQVEVLMPTMRCSMPSRAQPGLDRDKVIGTTIRDANSNNLGVYAKVTRSGTVRVGDSVHAT